MSVKNAFDFATSLRTVTGTFVRRNLSGPDTTKPLIISPSNFSRIKEGPSNTVAYGKEYLLTKSQWDTTGLDKPKRGDIFIDPVDGEEVIEKVETLRGVGEEVVGYRFTTN